MTNRAIDAAVVARIFKRLRQIYGSQKFLTALEVANVESDTELWIEQLTRRRFTLERIAKALEVCIDHHPVFVPTIGEFLALCEKCSDLMPRAFVALTNESKPDPALAQKYLEQIKIVSKAKNSDWATTLLNRSLNESQINHTSQRMALDALAAHGRLGEVPAAWIERNKAVWNGYSARSA